MFIFNAPEWFAGYDIFLEAAFAIITLLVAWHAYKVYKITEERQLKIFGFAFLFISISYFLQSFLNYSILSSLNQNICQVLQLNNLMLLNSFEYYTHISLYLLGLLTLSYMTLKIRSKKTFFLLALLTIIAVFTSPIQHYVFYIISTVLLLLIAIHYFINYLKHKQVKTLLVLAAFLLLLFGSIHYLFAVDHSKFYVISHFLELIAYILILINLILVSRK